MYTTRRIFSGGTILNPTHSCKTRLSILRFLDYDKRTRWKIPLDKKKHEWFFCKKCKTPVLVEIKISKTFPDPRPAYTYKEKSMS